ncbi:MAG: serine hydrolase [Eggerthellaceae bacterium]|nr:serine hydrolase [Eggerthellaceae bacterium]
MESAALASGLDVSIAYASLVDPSDHCSVRGGESRTAASLIKLVVLADVLDQAAAGAHPLSEPCVVQAGDIVGGSGVVQGMGAGASLTIGELAGHMICQSDNTAANILIDLEGMDSVNAQARKLRLDGTSLNRKMMDEEAIAAGVENAMSANDAATLLQMIYNGRLVNEEMSAFALDLLRQQQVPGGIELGIPDGATVAHKTGSLANVENDAAIVLAAKPYVLVVMASGGSGEAKRFAADVSEIAWAHAEGG